MKENERLNPAFPFNELNQTTGDIWTQHFGMTKKEVFAGFALVGLLAKGYAADDRTIGEAMWIGEQMAERSGG